MFSRLKASPHSSKHVAAQTTRFLFHLASEFSSRSIFLCDQQQTLVELKDQWQWKNTSHFSVVFGFLLTVLTSFLTAAGDSLHFTTVPGSLYFLTNVCSVDLVTPNRFETAPSDFPNLFQSIMQLFWSVPSCLEFPIAVLAAESNEWIKQDPLNCAQTIPPAVINPDQSEDVKRPRHRENLSRTTFCDHQSRSFKLLYAYFWSSEDL